MAKGYKTGGRTKGVGNKPKPLKQSLETISEAYYMRIIPVEDAELADALRVPVGTLVSRCEIDQSAMTPAERAASNERLLRYNHAQMQAVSAEISAVSDDDSLEHRLARLAGTGS